MQQQHFTIGSNVIKVKVSGTMLVLACDRTSCGRFGACPSFTRPWSTLCGPGLRILRHDRYIHTRRHATGRPLPSFLIPTDPPEKEPLGPEAAAEMVARAEHLLSTARERVEALRARSPAKPPDPRTSVWNTPPRPPPRTTITQAALPSFDWSSAASTSFDDEFEEDEDARMQASSSSNKWYGSGSQGSWSGAQPGRGPGSIDSWFGDKVETGPVAQRVAAPKRAAEVAVLERLNVPSSLEFGRQLGEEAILEFPASFEEHFQDDIVEEENIMQSIEGGSLGKSGEEFGPDGYWHRWTKVSGQDETGATQWYERWWEVSDWKGMKELGAEKWGCNANGDAWRETWRETISVDPATGQPSVTRSAHKWATNAKGNEWEEKWSEYYLSKGAANKSASKWAREGAKVWHEEWGEDYDGQGGCVKFTNKWAEDTTEEGKREWGDKWEERFKDGRGAKTGETWSIDASGEHFNRWWGEDHHGDGTVRRHGHSTTGEHWDAIEHMDTYYNPIPHFGYDLALAHSPQLKGVPVLPWQDEDDDLERTGFNSFLGLDDDGDGCEDEEEVLKDDDDQEIEDNNK